MSASVPVKLSPRPSQAAADMITPAAVRNVSPRDVPCNGEMAIRFKRAMLAVRLSLEIQSKCGLWPLSESQKSSLAGHRAIAARSDRRRRPDDESLARIEARLVSAYNELLAQAPCSHCEARLACPGASAVLLQ